MQRFSEFFLNHWDLFLALGILLALLVWNVLRGRFSGFSELEPAQAVQVMNRDDALVLDVREDSEFREGHIANARHIPLGALRDRLSELENYKDKAILVACRSGNRSGQGAGLLAKNGFRTVYNLRGGVGAWQSAGLPLTKGGKKKG